MNLLDFVFRLGVVFAIYGFIWGLIEIAILLLSKERKRQIAEIYIIKGIKYFFLVDVVFLFCFHSERSDMLVVNQVVFAGIILLTYFLGKLQMNQNNSMFFKMVRPGGQINFQTAFNMFAEITVISISLLIFALFWFYPSYAANPISQWFHDSIIGIENTPVFGFIFKIIGFFFLVSLIFKMLNAFLFMLSGGRVLQKNNLNQSSKDDDNFDDYEEIN